MRFGDRVQQRRVLHNRAAAFKRAGGAMYPASHAHERMIVERLGADLYEAICPAKAEVGERALTAIAHALRKHTVPQFEEAGSQADTFGIDLARALAVEQIIRLNTP